MWTEQTKMQSYVFKICCLGLTGLILLYNTLHYTSLTVLAQTDVGVSDAAPYGSNVTQKKARELEAFTTRNIFLFGDKNRCKEFVKYMHSLQELIDKSKMYPVDVHENGNIPSRIMWIMNMYRRFEQYLRYTNNSLIDVRSIYKLDDTESLFFNMKLPNIIENAIDGSPLAPLSQYRNPCWTANMTSRKSQTTEGSWHLMCLPLVYVIGVSKSGTTDIWSSLVAHPEFHHGSREPSYWSKWRLWTAKSLESYSTSFPMGNGIYRNDQNPEHAQQKLLVDASASALWKYDGWQLIPGNKGLREPKYFMAQTLKAFVPQAKLVVILRDPTSRLYSHFRMKRPSLPASVFHSWVVKALNNTLECFRLQSIRSCAYNMTLPGHLHIYMGGVVLRAGLYAVFLRDWLQVYPREQFHIIFGEDYYTNRTSVLVDLFKFVGVSTFATEEISKIVNRPVSNSRESHHRSAEPMLPETKILLDEFYKPFSKLLAHMLHDIRYEWRA